jgi:hypothetical protein
LHHGGNSISSEKSGAGKEGSYVLRRGNRLLVVKQTRKGVIREIINWLYAKGLAVEIIIWSYANGLAVWVQLWTSCQQQQQYQKLSWYVVII